MVGGEEAWSSQLRSNLEGFRIWMIVNHAKFRCLQLSGIVWGGSDVSGSDLEGLGCDFEGIGNDVGSLDLGRDLEMLGGDLERCAADLVGLDTIWSGLEEIWKDFEAIWILPPDFWGV
jgi:hypothetical protein